MMSKSLLTWLLLIFMRGVAHILEDKTLIFDLRPVCLPLIVPKTIMRKSSVFFHGQLRGHQSESCWRVALVKHLPMNWKFLLHTFDCRMGNGNTEISSNNRHEESFEQGEYVTAAYD